MELDEYENDPYAPDPRASQRVAAHKRAQQYDDDDEPTTTKPPQQLIVGIVGVLAVVGVLALALSGHGAPAPGALVITPGPSTAAFLAAPTDAPTATPTDAPDTRTINAYAAPDGALLGPIAADRAIVPTAHYGSDWIAYQDGAGLVWVRKSDRPDLALTGPDLAPVVAAPQTGRGLAADQGGESPTYLEMVGQQAPHSPRGDVIQTMDPALRATVAAQPTMVVADLSATMGPMTDAEREVRTSHPAMQNARRAPTAAP